MFHKRKGNITMSDTDQIEAQPPLSAMTARTRTPLQRIKAAKPAPATRNGPDPNSKRGRCAKLLLRANGATVAEIEKIVGRKPTLRFLAKLATRDNATSKVDGDRWYLIKG
jgi:hypothetical protein